MPSNRPKPCPPKQRLTARPLPVRIRAQVDQLLDRLAPVWPAAVWPTA
jgi:hypothetical protein